LYERSYGYKYAETFGAEGAGRTRYLSAAEIAKLMRADIKQAVAGGLLPADWKYSVRPHNFSGGRSIDITVKSGGGAWQECTGIIPGSEHTGTYTKADGTVDTYTTDRSCGNVWCKAGGQYKDEPSAAYHDILTAEAQAAKMTLERIHFAYNHDGSDIQTDYFDVNFYGHVSFATADAERWHADEAAKLAAKRAARDAGEVVGKVRVYKREGTVTHLLVKTADGKQALACGARPRRGSVGSAPDDAVLSCSRCAKKEGA
jgi:hypothetical protein